jgi:DNA-binding GntR family transcriptional regulator
MYLKDKIYEYVIKDILNGAFKPGDYLTEMSLCERYKVSRTTVREALLRLSLEGFLTQFRKGGYLVKKISYEELFEFMDIRLVLETYATKLAVQKITDETLELLHKNSISNNNDDWLDMNNNFHLTIAQATGNKRLAKIIENLLYSSRRLSALDSNFLLSCADEEEHLAIYNAIKERDTEKAVKMMEKHLMASRERIKKYINVQFSEM